MERLGSKCYLESLMAFFEIVGKYNFFFLIKNLSVGLLYKSGLGLILFEFEKGVVFEFSAGLSEKCETQWAGIDSQVGLEMS